MRRSAVSTKTRMQILSTNRTNLINDRELINNREFIYRSYEFWFNLSSSFLVPLFYISLGSSTVYLLLFFFFFYYNFVSVCIFRLTSCLKTLEKELNCIRKQFTVVNLYLKPKNEPKF